MSSLCDVVVIRNKEKENKAMQTRVTDLMTENPTLISPDATLKEAAQAMRDIDCGVLPVGRGDQLKGMITDRDIVIRAVAKGKDISKERVKDYMTKKTCSCFELDTLEEAAEKMGKYGVSRLVVKDKADRVTGILSFGSMVRKDTDLDEVTRVVECAIRQHAA